MKITRISLRKGSTSPRGPYASERVDLEVEIILDQPVAVDQLLSEIEPLEAEINHYLAQKKMEATRV